MRACVLVRLCVCYVCENKRPNGDSAEHAPLGLYDLVHQADTALFLPSHDSVRRKEIGRREGGEKREEGKEGGGREKGE